MRRPELTNAQKEMLIDAAEPTPFPEIPKGTIILTRRERLTAKALQSKLLVTITEGGCREPARAVATETGKVIAAKLKEKLRR